VRRRLVAIGAAVLAAAAALVVVGRWEERRAAREEIAGMRATLAAVGGNIASPKISAYRYGPPDCLDYYEGPLLVALQLCFDYDGRLVETVDRRGPEPRYASLEYKPSLSTIRFPRTEVDKLLQLAAPTG
jgi:hypothetical protein